MRTPKTSAPQVQNKKRPATYSVQARMASRLNAAPTYACGQRHEEHRQDALHPAHLGLHGQAQ